MMPWLLAVLKMGVFMFGMLRREHYCKSWKDMKELCIVRFTIRSSLLWYRAVMMGLCAVGCTSDEDTHTSEM